MASAGMGPGPIRANSQTEPHCGDVGEHLTPENREKYETLHSPNFFLSKSVWLPPGTPDNIADTMAAAFTKGFEEDPDLAKP